MWRQHRGSATAEHRYRGVSAKFMFPFLLQIISRFVLSNFYEICPMSSNKVTSAPSARKGLLCVIMIFVRAKLLPKKCARYVQRAKRNVARLVSLYCLSWDLLLVPCYFLLAFLTFFKMSSACSKSSAVFLLFNIENSLFHPRLFLERVSAFLFASQWKRIVCDACTLFLFRATSTFVIGPKQ